VKGFEVKGYLVTGYLVSRYLVKGYLVEGYLVKGFEVKGFEVKGYLVGGYLVRGFEVKGYLVKGYLVSRYLVEGYLVIESYFGFSLRLSLFLLFKQVTSEIETKGILWVLKLFPLAISCVFPPASRLSLQLYKALLREEGYAANASRSEILGVCVNSRIPLGYFVPDLCRSKHADMSWAISRVVMSVST
jgi:hypothetical protein